MSTQSFLTSGGHSGSRKSFLKSGRRNSEDMGLQITSMADIFIIILVFLLKSYSSGQLNFAPSAGLILPSALAGEASIEALRLEISSSGVQVEGQPVVALNHYQFDKAEILPNGSTAKLNERLATERKRQLLIAQKNTDVKLDAKVIVVADQKVPYSTLKSVLASAALNGYTDFKLAVIRPN